MNELKVVENNTQIAEVIDYKAKAMEYLSSMGNTLPPQQQTQFLELAQAFHLNPFKREIYAVGYGLSWNIITGYEVYLKRAERIGKLDGWDATVVGSGENMTATVTIYRKDWSHPFKHTVLFSECAQKTKDGKLNSVWNKMPSFMLRKVAIAQGFRLCFPDEFGGMPYIADEMPNEEQMKEKNITPIEQVEIKPAPAPKTQRKPKIVPPRPFTDEQALELGRILKSELDDGTPIFKEEEMESYRVMLCEGKVDEAIAKAKEELTKRTTIPADSEPITDIPDDIF